MSEDLRTLKQQRKVIRTLITRLINNIDNILKKEDVNVDSLEENYELLVDKAKSLKELNMNILKLLQIEEIEVEIESAEEYNEKIIASKCRLSKRIKVLSCTASIESVQITSRERSDQDCNNKIIKTVKLPKLTIPKFFGDPSSWLDFYNQFESAIHNNENLTKVDKFNYLKTFLGGIAANAVSGFSLTDENYDSAIKLLKERFGRTDMLINAHMGHLLNIPALKNSNDILSLRNLYDKAEIQTRNLQALGVTSDMYGSLLCPILLKVIPSDLALEFNRRGNSDKNWDLKELMDFLRKELESRERAASIHKTETKRCYENKGKPDFSKYHNPVKDKTPSAYTLNTIAENHCPFCNEKHKPDNCKLSLHERKDSLRKHGKCFRCYRKFHRSKECRSSKIQCTNCLSKGHQSSLCEQTSEKHPLPSRPSEREEKAMVSSLVSHSSQGLGGGGQGYVYFQTLKCKIIGREKIVNVRLLLDSASQRSFINSCLSRDLGLEVTGHETLKIHTFAGKKDPPESSKNRVRVLLKDVNSDYTLSIEALEADNICPGIIRAPSSELQDEIKKLGFNLSDSSDGFNDEGKRIDILVGSDYYWSIVTGSIKRLSTSVVLNETKFGWTLHGSFSNTIDSNNAIGTMYTSIWDDSEDKKSIELQRFWDLESIGIRNETERENLCDKQILEQFEDSIKFKDDRYEVKLPMKFDVFDLPNNYDVAKKRFDSLIKRFQNNPTLFTEYNAIIEEYKSLGIVETVEPQEINSANGNLTYYLPHHPVIRKDKQTTNLRIVFDASAHAPLEPSLNDMLLPGPNLNSDLFDLILQFRSNNIAVVADIEKAFLQISLTESDRDLTRFLWMDQLPSGKNPQVKPIIMKMTRVLFGVTSSPFLLGAVIKHHVKKLDAKYPETCSMINSSMYVDDLLIGSSSVEQALKLTKESLDIFLQANMPLRKWQTNSPLLKEYLRSLDFDVCPENTLNTSPFKILGLIWDTEKDVFRLDNHNLSEFVNCQEKTKRTVIRAAGRIFDPVGFLSPFTVIIKIIFQSLWEQGIDWDENLPECLEKEWDSWCKQLPYLSQLEIPRYYFQDLQDTNGTVEIHSFCDASEKAFGAVIFLRIKRENFTKTTFVTSKCRLAPIKRLTLPRLELMGALIGARLLNRVLSVLKFSIDRKYLWTDSNIVLHWIKSSSSSWKPFVSNRVSEIQGLTNPLDWKHCPGRDNPADRLTRGLSLTNLETDKLWWFGPPWLIKDSEFWPKEARDINNGLKQEEARRKVVYQNFCSSDSQKPLVEIERVSSLLKMIRVIAWVKRFVFNLRNTIKRTEALSTDELREAEEFCIREVQMKIFSSEIEALRSSKNISPKSKIFCLAPFLDENQVLRIKGRLNETEYSLEEKHPVLLPREARFTELLVIREHKKMMHAGVAATLMKVRQRFWIPKGRQLVRKVINNCLICKKYSAKPAKQMTAQLPKDRISETPPFSITGVDFTGPVYVRQENEILKAYIVLFTCANTRAVHLELTSDLSTKRFILSLRRFLSRRGNCRVLYSDNAKTFKCANKDLQYFFNLVKHQELQNFLSSEGIRWKFIVELAPWWGGFYERLMKSIKEPLRKVLGRAQLTFEEFMTVLVEVENVLNQRPLTYVYNQANEPEPLTPAHFLLVGHKIQYPYNFAELFNTISTRESLLKRKEYQIRLLKQVWVKWKNLYLLDLKGSHFFGTPHVKRDLQIDDVVILEGANKSKLLWDIGRITEVMKGRDGLVRSCVVKTKRGQFKRPIQLLYPLELSD